jgi:hypothetical protein
MNSDANPAVAHEPQPGPPLSPSHDDQSLSIELGDIAAQPSTSHIISTSTDTSDVNSTLFSEHVLRDQGLVDRIISLYSDLLEEEERKTRLREISGMSRVLFESCSDLIWSGMNSLSPFLWLLPQSGLHDSGMVSLVNS